MTAATAWSPPPPDHHPRRPVKTKMEPARAPSPSTGRAGRLLDLGFAKLDVLLRDGIVLLLDQLVGHRARVLLGDVIEAGVRAGNQFDLDGDRFGHCRILTLDLPEKGKRAAGRNVGQPAFGR